MHYNFILFTLSHFTVSETLADTVRESRLRNPLLTALDIFWTPVKLIITQQQYIIRRVLINNLGQSSTIAAFI